jgi:hypothetical protein
MLFKFSPMELAVRVLIAAPVVCCLALLALAYAGQFPPVRAPEVSTVQIAQAKKKKDGCFTTCISKGRHPTACNLQCG